MKALKKNLNILKTNLYFTRCEHMKGEMEAVAFPVMLRVN